MSHRSFPRYAWAVLAYTALAAVWGAFVRATGSGAGCGNHWPLCNGEVVPRAPALATMIELSHRVSSGVVGPLAIVLAVWAVRRFGRRHPAALAAIAALVLTVIEGLIGAALVRFELVGENASVARGFVMAGHLVNTFFLLGAMALTGAWGSGWGLPRAGGRPREGTAFRDAASWLVAGGVVALCVLGASGAVTALGDTLFPVATLSAESLAELPAGVRLLVRLRVLHPFLAAGAAAYLLVMAAALRSLRPLPRVLRLSTVLGVLFATELAVGLVNVALAAPVWIQLLHLGLAYGVWVALVLLGAAALGEDAPDAAAARLGNAAPPAAAPGGRRSRSPVAAALEAAAPQRLGSETRPSIRE